MDFRQQYKKKKFGFGDADEGRMLRAVKHVESCKEQRAKSFARNRNLEETVNQKTPNKEVQPVTEDRKHKLLQWRIERDRQKKLMQRQKKPAFKVGMVHHKFYSPAFKESTVDTRNPNDNPHKHVKLPSNPPTKRITKATEKRLLAKAAAAQKQNVLKNNSENILKKKRTSPDKKQEESFAPINHKFRPPAGIPTIPFFGRVSLPRTPKKLQSSRKSSIRTAVKRTSMTLQNQTKEPSENDSKLRENRQSIAFKKIEEDSNVADSSIEAVNLRLSSDEQEDQTPSSNTSMKKATSPLHTTPTEQQQDKPCNEPVYFSPYIVCSRGKSNARKEQQVKRGFGFSPTDDIPTKENVMKSLNISTEEEEKTAQYFKFLLNREIERLKELCDKWTEIKSEADITEDAQYQINQATGQTYLLMNKKFERFRGLVLDCETGKGEMLVTCKDLQGFWDMMYMEIKDCDSRFDKLEKLLARNWEEEQPVIIKPVVKKKIGQKKKIVSTKQSSIKALISAAKKKKMLANAGNSGDSTSDKGYLITIANDNYSDPVKKRSRSLGPGDHKFTPGKRDSVRLSLLQKMQLSETSKKLRSPLTIIKISQMCKTPEIHLDDTISYVNSDQTPGKSILKKSDDVIEKELRIKSGHKVNFNEQVVLNEVPVDKELQAKMDLAVALTRIDSYDLDRISPEIPIKAERKLNFEDDSSEESENVFTDTKNNDSFDKTIKEDNYEIVHSSPKFEKKSMNENSKGTPLKKGSKKSTRKSNKYSTLLPSINFIAASPLVESKTNNELNTTYEKEESDTNIRILRSRSIDAKKTPKNTKSRKEFTSEDCVEKKENKSPITVKKRSKKNFMKIKEFSDESTNNTFNETAVDDSTKKRRSTRKSVRFTAEDCTACIETKPVLPMTPHARRSRTKKSE